MTSLLETIQSYIPADLTNIAAEKLDESDTGISRAFGGLIPTILSGLADKASNDGALGGLFETLNDQNNASFLEDLGGLINSGNLARNDPKDIAGAFLGQIFGDKIGGILNAIASFAGIKKDSAGSLLGLAGPLIMGAISKRIRNDNLSQAGFKQLLLGEKDMIRRSVPPQVSTVLGYPGAHQAQAAAARSAAAPQATGRPAWLWAIPALLGVGLVGWMLTRGGGDDETPRVVEREVVEPAARVAETTVTEVEEVNTDPADEVIADADAVVTRGVGEVENVEGTLASVTPIGDYVRTLGDYELRGASDGVEAKLIQFIESDKEPCTDSECWYTFDRLTFNTGSADLNMAQSEDQLTNMKAILEAYPDVQLKIGGYTDNTSSDDLNKQLSQERAEAVVAALAGMGIDSDRLFAEGYGSDHPVASNDTEEGRAQNRRIDVRVRQR